MKAIVLTQYGSKDVLELRDVEKPLPKDDEVSIAVCATSVNDWDWCLMRGTPFYIRMLCGLRQPRVQIPGAEVAGRVEAVGKNVTRFKPGDAVYGDISECGFGGWAEYVCVPETALALKPDSMSFAEAAALPHASMLAVQGLCDRGEIRPGQSLLVNGGGGGVGTLAVQIANAIGVEDVTGVDRASKSEAMRSVGFARTIDYERDDFTRQRQHYDLILDTKTNRSLFKYLRVLNPRGRYVTVGGTTPRLLQALLLGPLARIFGQKQASLVSLQPNKELDYINELFEAGKIKPAIDGPYQLEEIPQIIHYFGEGKHTGKVVISLQ